MKNLEALEQKHKELGEEIERLKRQGSGVTWKPEVGQDYWVLNDCGEPEEQCNRDQKWTDTHAAIGNCFPTREAAERHRDKLILMQELRDFANFKPDWGDPSCLKFRILHSTARGFYVEGSECINCLGGVYFPSHVRTEGAIEHFGKRLDLLLD